MTLAVEKTISRQVLVDEVGRRHPGGLQRRRRSMTRPLGLDGD